jgi:hypothetical protein
MAPSLLGVRGPAQLSTTKLIRKLPQRPIERQTGTTVVVRGWHSSQPQLRVHLLCAASQVKGPLSNGGDSSVGLPCKPPARPLRELSNQQRPSVLCNLGKFERAATLYPDSGQDSGRGHGRGHHTYTRRNITVKAAAAESGPGDVRSGIGQEGKRIE